MDPIKNAQRIISREYGLLRLPPILSPDFTSLIRGSKELLNITLNARGSHRKARSMSVSFEAGASASTDENSNVRIPAWYCWPESLEVFVGRKMTKEEATAVSLMLINGSSIHEALHVAHSEYLFKNPTIKANLEGKRNKALAYHLMNITEDLKNESMMKDHPELERFVDGKNEIFFSEEIFRSTMQKAVDAYGEDDYKSIALEILVSYKNKSRRKQVNEYLNSNKLSLVSGILSNCCNPYVNAYEMAMKLYEIFEETEAAESTDNRMMEGERAEKAEKTAEEAKANEEFELDVDMEMGDGEIPPLEEIDVLQNTYGSYSYPGKFKPENSNDFAFLKQLKVNRQVVPTLNEPRKAGTILVGTRLSRIATDGKIFSRRGEAVAAVAKKLPEFIILDDFSGSTGGELNELILNITYKMSKAMMEVGISHSVYAHTSHRSNDVPTVFHIFSHHMNGKTSSDHKVRFEKAAEIELRENYDGYAIAHVAKKFNRDSTKVLLVLSDGRPAGPGYEEIGSEHTREAIAQARKMGIKVISLSLVNHVIGFNDQLYGKKFNIDATTPAKLEAGMKKLILGG